MVILSSSMLPIPKFTLFLLYNVTINPPNFVTNNPKRCTIPNHNICHSYGDIIHNNSKNGLGVGFGSGLVRYFVVVLHGKRVVLETCMA